jgi:Flp pilus assembly protein TadD
MRALQPLIDLRDVGPEATVRLARLRVEAGQFAIALDLVNGLETRTIDAALVYLARLFRGKALEHLDRRTDARQAYESALRTKPRAESASLALAALAFLDNDLDTADRLVTEAATAPYAIDTPSFAASSATDDPWIKYWLGDMRNWNALLTAVRAQLK